MRHVEITRREFRHFVWPSLAYSPVENGGQVDAHVRLLRKVKGSSEPAEETDEGKIAPRELNEDGVTFHLEEDEWGHLKRRLEKWLPSVAGGVLDEFAALQNRLEAAEQFEAE